MNDRKLECRVAFSHYCKGQKILVSTDHAEIMIGMGVAEICEPVRGDVQIMFLVGWQGYQPGAIVCLPPKIAAKLIARNYAVEHKRRPMSKTRVKNESAH